MKNIVILSCHADDAELGTGIYIQVMKKLGYKIKVLVATGSEPDREAESRRALDILGVNEKIYLKHHENNLLLNEKLINDIEGHIDDDTEYLLTHAAIDAHQSHQIIHKAGLIVGRLVPNVLLYEVIGPSNLGIQSFNPQYFAHCEDDMMNKKIDALSQHKSQVKKYRKDWLDAVKGLAKYRACQYDTYNEKYGYVEAFEVVKMRAV